MAKNRKAGLDRPLKVGGGIQPRLVTVLTPATTFTVGQDFIQNRRAVNRRATFINFLNDFVPRNGTSVVSVSFKKLMAGHTGQSSQLFPVALGRNAQFRATTQISLNRHNGKIT